MDPEALRPLTDGQFGALAPLVARYSPLAGTAAMTKEIEEVLVAHPEHALANRHVDEAAYRRMVRPMISAGMGTGKGDPQRALEAAAEKGYRLDPDLVEHIKTVLADENVPTTSATSWLTQSCASKRWLPTIEHAKNC